MTQLNFFDYLGLDQFNSDEEFVVNLKNFDYEIYRNFDSNGYTVEYISCQEVKKKYIDYRDLVNNPNLFRYLNSIV